MGRMFGWSGARIGLVTGSVLAGLLATAACGDDDSPSGPSDGSGGSTGDGGAGSGGTKATGGSTSSGGAKATGGSTSTGGASTGGTSAGGTGGASDGGSGGTEPDGGSTDGGEEPPAWEMGKKSTGGADSSKEDRYYTPVFDAAGNVYAAGYVNTAGDRAAIVAKYDANGVLVTSGWGTGGVVTLNYNPYAGDADNTLTTAADDKFASAEEARDLAFQSNGKLVVATVVEEVGNTFNRQIVVYRLNTDGTPDNDFGTQGKFVVDWSEAPTAANTTNDTVWGLDVDANDKIYLFGSGRSRGAVPTTTDRFVTRLKPNGGFDETFVDAGGTFTIDTPTNSANPPTPPSTTQPTFLGLNDNARHGFALPGGGVVASGYTNVGGRNQVVIWKLKEDGTRDTSYSGDGITRSILFPNGVAEAYGAAILSDGTIVTTGYGTVDVDLPANLDIVSTALTSTGAVDRNFGVQGSLAIDLARAEERGRYAMALPDDRILFAGAGSPTAGNKDAMLVLLERDGTPVPNFGPEGRQLYDFGTANEEFYGAALSKDGKWIAAAGYTSPPAADAAQGNGFVVILPVGQ